MDLMLLILAVWALLSGALTAIVAAFMAHEHLRARRRGGALVPGDDLVEPPQAAPVRGDGPRALR